MNSNFCLGVWKQVGQCRSKLNYFATYWDSTTYALVGPVRSPEEVTLNPALPDCISMISKFDISFRNMASGQSACDDLPPNRSADDAQR